MDLKLAALIFIMAAPVLAGIAALVPLTMYGTVSIPPTSVPIAAAIGAVLGIPVALIVAKKISALTAGRRAA